MCTCMRMHAPLGAHRYNSKHHSSLREFIMNVTGGKDGGKDDGKELFTEA